MKLGASVLVGLVLAAAAGGSVEGASLRVSSRQGHELAGNPKAGASGGEPLAPAEPAAGTATPPPSPPPSAGASAATGGSTSSSTGSGAAKAAEDSAAAKSKPKKEEKVFDTEVVEAGAKNKAAEKDSKEEDDSSAKSSSSSPPSSSMSSSKNDNLSKIKEAVRKLQGSASDLANPKPVKADAPVVTADFCWKVLEGVRNQVAPYYDATTGEYTPECREKLVKDCGQTICGWSARYKALTDSCSSHPFLCPSSACSAGGESFLTGLSAARYPQLAAVLLSNRQSIAVHRDDADGRITVKVSHSSPVGSDGVIKASHPHTAASAKADDNSNGDGNGDDDDDDDDDNAKSDGAEKSSGKKMDAQKPMLRKLEAVAKGKKETYEKQEQKEKADVKEAAIAAKKQEQAENAQSKGKGGKKEKEPTQTDTEARDDGDGEESKKEKATTGSSKLAAPQGGTKKEKNDNDDKVDDGKSTLVAVSSAKKKGKSAAAAAADSDDDNDDESPPKKSKKASAATKSNDKEDDKDDDDDDSKDVAAKASTKKAAKAGAKGKDSDDNDNDDDDDDDKNSAAKDDKKATGAKGGAPTSITVHTGLSVEGQEPVVVTDGFCQSVLANVQAKKAPYYVEGKINPELRSSLYDQCGRKICNWGMKLADSYKEICSHSNGICPSDCNHPVTYVNGLVSGGLLGTYQSNLATHNIITVSHAPAALTNPSLGKAVLVTGGGVHQVSVSHASELQRTAPLVTNMGSSVNSISANDPRDPQFKAQHAASSLSDIESSAKDLANKILSKKE